MEKLEFLFSLLDRLSGPAKSMKTATESVASELDKVNTELQRLDKQAVKTRLDKVTDPLQKQRVQLRLNRDELKHQQQQMKGAAEATQGFSLANIVAGNALSGMATSALSAVAGVARAELDMGVQGAKFVTESLAFKETTLTALKVMTGTEASAQRIFNDALVFAKRTPFETNQVVGGFTQLLGAGFKESEVTRVFAAIGDAAAASGFDTQVVDRMVLAFSQIKAKGRLMGGELLQVNEALAKTGVGTADIYREIGRAMGVSAQQAMKLQEAGKVGADTAIFGILKALEGRSGGAVGNLMAEQSKTLTGLLSTLKSAPQDLVLSMDLSRMTGFQSFKGVVDNLAQALDTTHASGQRAQRALESLFNATMDGLFGSLSGASGLARMEALVNRVAEAADRAAPMLRASFSALRGFVDGFTTSLLHAIGAAQRLTGGDSLDPKKMEAMGESLGRLAGKLTVLLNPLVLVVEAAEWVRATVTRAWEALKTLGNAAVEVGGQIASGLVSGMRSGIGMVFGASDELGAAASAGAKQHLQINSPSRLFAEYGAFTAEGFEQGVRGGTDGAVDAVQGLGDARPFASGSARGGRGSGGTTHEWNINLQLPANASGDARTFAEQVRDSLLALLPEVLPPALEVQFSGLAVEGGEG